MAKQILTYEMVHEFRTSGLTDAFLAKKYGIGYVTVHNARRGITFKDHPTPPDIALRKPGGRGQGAQALRSDKNCGKPALTAEDVHRIRTCGLPDADLARELNVSCKVILDARRGRTWQDHPTPPDLFPRQFGQITYKGKKALPLMVALPCEPVDPVLVERLRTRCQLDEHGCWIWTGSVSGSKPRPSGHHGQTTVNGRQISTHRAMYAAVYGPIPDGMHVCHTCDKPRCVNPKHLWLGTHLDNMRDSISKGRHVNVRDRAKPTVSAATVRALAGGACQCRGECGVKHPRIRCPQGGGGASFFRPFIVIGQRQYCERCAKGISARRRAGAGATNGGGLMSP